MARKAETVDRERYLLLRGMLEDRRREIHDKLRPPREPIPADPHDARNAEEQSVDDFVQEVILFFTVGQPFGTLNDICNGLAAVLSAVLVGMLYPKLHAQSPILSQVTLTIAIFGAILALVGSYLAISGVSGWYLAGLYTVTDMP